MSYALSLYICIHISTLCIFALASMCVYIQRALFSSFCIHFMHCMDKYTLFDSFMYPQFFVLHHTSAPAHPITRSLSLSLLVSSFFSFVLLSISIVNAIKVYWSLSKRPYLLVFVFLVCSTRNCDDQFYCTTLCLYTFDFKHKSFGGEK